MIASALKRYGASLGDDGIIIAPSGRKTTVKAVTRNGRLRFEDATGYLIASGPVSDHWVRSFVERFWSWEIMQ